MRVLVVEDDIVTGADIFAQLAQWGYRCDGPHQTSEKALRALDRQLPDIGILDYDLGNGDTTRLVAARLIKAGIPIIWLTGYLGTEISEMAGLEPEHMLEKPVLGRQLRKSLDRVR